MAVYKEISKFSRAHEHIADFFSLLAVVLLFGSIWVILQYYTPVSDWIRHDPVWHTVLVIGALVLDVVLILSFLAFGSARFGDKDERSFGTFAGRRNQRSPTGIFGSWLKHMESVGKKHR